MVARLHARTSGRTLGTARRWTARTVKDGGAHVTPRCGRWTIQFEDGDEEVKMLDESFDERLENTTNWDKMWMRKRIAWTHEQVWYE